MSQKDRFATAKTLLTGLRVGDIVKYEVCAQCRKVGDLDPFWTQENNPFRGEVLHIEKHAVDVKPIISNHFIQANIWSLRRCNLVPTDE